MAINRVSGQMLSSNLVRDGVDLSVETDLLYVDVINGRIGINNAMPAVDFHITGVAKIDGALSVDTVSIDNSTITATTGDLLLSSTSGNISVNSKRILACADPVGVLDVVNLQTLTAATGGISASQIIADDTRVTIVDDGISAGLIEFAVDNSVVGTLTSTQLVMTGNVTSLTADVGNINLATNIISSDVAQLNVTASDLRLNGAVTITGLATSRILFVDSSGVVNSKPQFTYASNILQLDGTFIVDLLTFDGGSLTTTLDNDFTINSGIGLVDITSTSAIQLPTGTTAQRPGTLTTVATALIVGNEYEITTTGDTDFTLVGAANSTPGTIFTATVVGIGTGTVTRTIQEGLQRWNSTLGAQEYYDGVSWTSPNISFSVTSQQFIPDGVQTLYTLNKAATTDSLLVSINGLVQDPQGGTVYSVSGTTLTLSSVLPNTDIMSVRFLES